MTRAALTLLLSSLTLAAQSNAVTPGKFHVEHPTLVNMGFEWPIEGDANRNATVTVRFRKVGATAWRQALPLLRIGGENVYRRKENLDYTVPHGFAGSILNVEPGTEYECEFTMADPDGVSGTAVQTVKVRTRTEPKAYAGGRKLHVYPPDYFGPREQPSFTGILQAYYGAGLGDWSVVWERRAQPGDTLLVHAGLYRPEKYNYVDPMMTPFDASMSLTLKGTAEKPITIQAAGDGEVVFDGDGNHRFFDVMASRHHIFDGLTFRNTDIAIFAGQKEVLGAVGLTVKNCRFEGVGFGVWTEYAGSSDFYIADNLFLGRDDRFRLIGWGGRPREPGGNTWAEPLYGSHRLTSYYAVKVYGQGHVIAHNIRVFNNRGVNAAQGGYSSQPVFGGPAYFIRNILYHVPSGVAFKFSAKPAGLIVYHNTIIGEHLMGDPSANMHFRNNLFLGRNTPDRGVMRVATSSNDTTLDYNAFRPNPGVAAQYSYFAPPKGQRVYEPTKEQWQTFPTLAALAKATGQETHSIEVDFDIFEKLTPPDPARKFAVYHAMDLNFKLKPASKAVDAGAKIPTVNEDHTGNAPDLGALEVGKPVPHYGPRWLTWQPFYR